ncbi:MAG: sigma-70 family RNA polymerase sigma factor [bacterium]|nr:sigma-70 family RNA polymerase sigma factor [bacterium]
MDSAELELVRQAKQGNITAFEQLFNRYQKRIYTYIVRMIQNSEDSAELTQDTFIRAYHSLKTLKAEEAFNSWLHRIAINLVRDKLRKFEPIIESIDKPDVDDNGTEFKFDIPDWSANPRKVTLQQELQKKIQTAIASLPKQQREVVILYHIEGLDISEISHILEIPSGTIKSRLARARDILRVKLKYYVSC